jgi:hypothetical protein
VARRTGRASQLISVIGLGRQDDGFGLKRSDDRRRWASVQNLPAERGDIVGGEGCGPTEPQPPTECRNGLLRDTRDEQGQDFIRHMIRRLAPLFGVPQRDIGRMDDPSASRRAIVAALIRVTGADHLPRPPAGADRSAASAPEASMQARATAANTSDRCGDDLIGVDDVVARNLVAFERTACPLWTLPARSSTRRRPLHRDRTAPKVAGAMR